MNTKSGAKEEKKKIFHSRPIFYGFLALMLATTTSKFIFDGNVRYIIFDIVILLVLGGFCLFWKSWKTLVVLLAFFAFGLGWFFVGFYTFEGKEYVQPVTVVGRISDDVKQSQYGGSATVVLKDVTIDGSKENNISLMIKYKNEDDFAIGDIIAFEGKVEKVHLFTLGKMNNWLYRDRTPYSCTISSDDMKVQGNHVRFDEKFRLRVKSQLYANMGQKNGSAAFAVLFGDKNDLDGDVYDAYNSAGIVHLLTVSGLHVSFLMVLLGWFLKKCRVRGIWNLLVCTIFLLGYAYLCGFSPSVLRAGIMGLVLFSTSLFGKQYDRLCSAGLAGMLILLFSPLSALDMGFQLSFFCVLSIFIISPWLSKFFKKFLPKYVAEAFSISIGTSIGLLPILPQMNSGIVVLGFFVNLLVISIFAVLFPLLFVSALLTAALPFMGFLLKVCGWGFEVIEAIARFFGQSNLRIKPDEFDIFFIAGFYLFFYLLSRFFMASKKTKVICCSSVFALSGLLFGLSFVQFPVGASITYGFNYSSSVVVLTNSSGQSIIVDMGYEDYTKRLLNVLQIKGVDTAFVLQAPTIKIDTANEIGVETIVRSDEGQGYDHEVCLDFDEAASFKGFNFVYRGQGGRVTGLEISFDQTTVFILKDWNTSRSAIAALPTENYDFVILGKHEQYAEYFDPSSKLLTYYNCPSADSSFEKNGNISYSINGENYKRRCLD